jgi:glycine cleavage system aminomethyltransferase T
LSQPSGALAYASASVESGWVPSPVPAIYTGPELADYRRWLPLFGIEGQRPLNGSFYSPDIEDYYVSPWELGYGRSISFNHDFIGRDALLAARESAPRTKVTLVLDPAEVDAALGAGHGFYLTYARHRVELASAPGPSSASPTRPPPWTPRARSWRSRSSTRSTPCPAPR